MAAHFRHSEVIIIGAGISGMLAALACLERGRSFVIVDKGPEPELPRLVKGCVYLHKPCGLKVRSQALTTTVLPVNGVPYDQLSQMYHEKIWPGEPYSANSMDKYMGVAQVWSMNDALQILHSRFSEHIKFNDVSMIDVDRWLDDGHRVVNTAPLWAMVPGTLVKWKPLWVWQALTKDGWLHAYTVYNADPGVTWYRVTAMFGSTSVEFIAKPEGLGVASFRKIISYDMTTLDARHPNLLFTGRWGRWQRGFLSHMTYDRVGELLEGAWR